MSELQTLTNMVAALQRQINDLSVQVTGQSQTISDQGGDIHDLQNPPTGVPPPLLGWLSSHGIREVDTHLDTDLDTLTTSLSTHTSDITDLSNRIDAEETARIELDTNINDSQADLQTQVTTNTGDITQEITDRSALSVTVSEGLDAVNGRVDDTQSDLSALMVSNSTASSSLSDQIASLSSSLQVAQTQITLLQGIGVDPAGAQASQITSLTTIANDAATAVAQETTDRVNADTVLQASILTLNSSVSGFSTNLASEKSDRQAADTDLSASISVISSEVAGHGGLISSETAARIAADEALTTSTSNNEDDIVTVANNVDFEASQIEDADTALQTLVDTNTASVASNSATIAVHDTKLTAINSRFSVVKDNSGYVTGWRIIDESTAAGAFKLLTLNNDAKLLNTGYAGQYFPAVATSSFSVPDGFDTSWGGATSSDFQGGDTNSYTRQVKVYATQTAAYNGSCFFGTNNGIGGSAFRLGQVLTTFNVDFGGYANRYLSLWYRIKNSTGVLTDRWFPVAMADNVAPGASTYGYVRQQATIQISVPVDKVIEFGITVLNTFDTTIGDPLNDLIYGGSVSVEALNMATIS